MSAIVIGLGLLVGCSPKQPTTTGSTNTTPVDPDAQKDSDAQEYDSREIWGGFNGFMVFAIKDATTRASLGSFAVQDNPTPDGNQHASTYGWEHGNDKEAWEWSGSAWPDSGFILDVEPAASRGTATINVFTHTAFPPSPTNLTPPAGNQTVLQLSRIDPNQSAQPVGWLLVEKGPTGALLSLTWVRDPAVQGPFIAVEADQELHATPIQDLGALPASAQIIMQQPD